MDINMVDDSMVHAPEQKLIPIWHHITNRNADQMNTIFLYHFGLDPRYRYMGSFPYPAKGSRVCRVSWIISTDSRSIRDSIVDALRTIIQQYGLVDITVELSHISEFPTDRPFRLEIVAMGDSITDNLVGERRVQALLVLLEASLTLG